MVTVAAEAATKRRYVTGASERFITTVISDPSSFTNDVLSSWLRLATVLTLFAPGRMNLEK
jgi:hypothetical protein